MVLLYDIQITADREIAERMPDRFVQYFDIGCICIYELFLSKLEMKTNGIKKVAIVCSDAFDEPQSDLIHN